MSNFPSQISCHFQTKSRWIILVICLITGASAASLRGIRAGEPGPEGPGERMSGRGFGPRSSSAGVPPRPEGRGLPLLDDGDSSEFGFQLLSATPATVPKNLDICFSPDEPCDMKLAEFIQTANKSLDIAIFDFNLDKVVHETLVAFKKKIKVRVLVDKRQAKGPHSLVGLLIKAGVPVKFGHQRGIMHNKFTIVDGKMIETGSFNYTNHAFKANNENQIYLSEPKVVERFQKRFDEIWGEGVVATLDKVANPSESVL